MRGIVLFCLFVLGLYGNEIPYRGLLMVATKLNFANDILLIAKSLVQNARYWNFPNIVETENDNPLSPTKHIMDLEIRKVEFYPDTVANLMQYDPVGHTVLMSSDKPVVKYQIHFNWRVVLFGLDIGLGDADATLLSRSFKTTVTLPDKPFHGELMGRFTAEIGEVRGYGQSDGVKNWLKSRLSDSMTTELNYAYGNNTDFFHNDLFKNLARADRKANDNYTLTYYNRPVNTSEFGGYMYVAFDTEIAVNDIFTVVLNKEYTYGRIVPIKDVGIALSPGLVSMTAELYGRMGMFDREYDIRIFGYSGTMQDFFVPMPELAISYNATTSVSMNCYIVSVTDVQQGTHIRFETLCYFSGNKAGEKFLQTKVTQTVACYSDVTNDPAQLIIAQLGKATITALETYPASFPIREFTFRFFMAMGKVIYEGQQIHVPRLRYEPRRPYTKFLVPTKITDYIAIYETADN